VSATTRPVYRGGKGNRVQRDDYQQVTDRITTARTAWRDDADRAITGMHRRAPG
jgi:hypothetical protein